MTRYTDYPEHAILSDDLFQAPEWTELVKKARCMGTLDEQMARHHEDRECLVRQAMPAVAASITSAKDATVSSLATVQHQIKGVEMELAAFRKESSGQMSGLAKGLRYWHQCTDSKAIHLRQVMEHYGHIHDQAGRLGGRTPYYDSVIIEDASTVIAHAHEPSGNASNAVSTADPASSTPQPPPRDANEPQDGEAAPAAAPTVATPIEEAPIYHLMPCRTVAEVWAEWVKGSPRYGPLRELNARWGSAIRPEQKQRTAFCRRLRIINAITARIGEGASEEAAVAAIELMRLNNATGTLYALTEKLKKS